MLNKKRRLKMLCIPRSIWIRSKQSSIPFHDSARCGIHSTPSHTTTYCHTTMYYTFRFNRTILGHIAKVMNFLNIKKKKDTR
jgi:hypothetical protein